MGRIATLMFAVLLLACSVTPGETSIDVSYGWGEPYRTGAWTPIFVTLSDLKPRNAMIELVSPGDSGGAAMRIRQAVAIGPEPTTYPLLAPLSYNLVQTVLTVRDLDSKRRIAEFLFSDPDNINWQSTYQYVTPDQLLIGVSGRSATMQLLERQLVGPAAAVSVGYLEPRFAPQVAEGYQSLNVLALNQPNLDAAGGGAQSLRFEQQRAIVDWVRAGGNLIFWAGQDPIPATSPIAMALPCRIGELGALKITPEALAAYGLPARFSQLGNRPLIPVDDAETFPILGDGSDALGCAKRLGFGHVVVLSIDASSLQFGDGASAWKFWRPILQRVTDVPENVEVTTTQTTSPSVIQDYQTTLEQRHANAVMSTMDLLGDVPGVGSFGFSYVVIVLIALMLVVGPIDWFVLKKLGKQPWTWVTTAGWITLVTAGAIYIGHIFRSGDLHLRTLRFIDQADGQTVAAVDMIGIYSPRTTWYELNVEPDGWYSPPNLGRYYYGGRVSEVPFHQDYQGNRPDRMLINVWNLRFVMGGKIKAGPPVIDAKLRIADGNDLEGTITNLSDQPLENIIALVGDRQVRLGDAISPGQTKTVDQVLTPAENEFRNEPGNSYSYYSYRNGGSGTFHHRTTELLSPQRTREVERLRKLNEPTHAIVYAQLSDPSPAATLTAPPQQQQHWQAVRALVPLEQTP